MLAFIVLLVSVAAAEGSQNAPRRFFVSGDRNCTNFIHAIPFSGRNTRYNFSIPEDDQQLTDLNIKDWTSGSTWMNDHTVGPSQVNGSCE